MSEPPEKDTLAQTLWSSVGSILYNKLSWFVSELPEKGISNVMVQRTVGTGSILQEAVVVCV